MSDLSEFGVWAMIAFWASAAGGIAFAISWARRKGANPASRDAIRRSLKKRLDQGELSFEEYKKRLAELDGG